MKRFETVILPIIGLVFVLLGTSAMAAGPGNIISVRLVGHDLAYPGDDLFDDYGVVGPASLCWDFDMLDLKTDEKVGDVTDCAAIIGVVETDLGLGYQVIGTTFFYFPGGTVVSRVYTSAMPKTHGSPTFTHITGAVPEEGVNNVLYGDGKFQGASGRVRFSGGGDLSNLFVDGGLSVNCIFTLEMHTGN